MGDAINLQRAKNRTIDIHIPTIISLSMSFLKLLFSTTSCDCGYFLITATATGVLDYSHLIVVIFNH